MRCQRYSNYIRILISLIATLIEQAGGMKGSTYECDSYSVPWNSLGITAPTGYETAI